MLDALAVNASVLIALWLWSRRQDAAFTVEYVVSRGHWFLFLTVLWLAVSYVNDLYDLKTAADRQRSITALVRAALIVFVIYPVIYFFLPPRSQARVPVFFSEVIAVFLLGLWRLVYSAAFTVPRFRRPAVIMGAGWAGRTIVEVVRDHLSLEYRLVGYVDDDPAKQDAVIAGLPVLGTSDQLMKVVQASDISEIVVAITHSIPGELVGRLVECANRGVQITPMTQLYERVTGKVAVEHVGTSWYFDLPIGGESSLSAMHFVKRGFDLLMAVIGLLISLPLYPLIALAIFADNPGPIFYTQKRVGLRGQTFRVIKFRSMVVGAERNGRARWATEKDRRVTRVGRFLRKTRLDELPQLINVLRGQMSIVGPRPERPEFIDELQEQIPFYRMRLRAKPGLTGWAQIHQRYAGSVQDSLLKLQYDLYYIRHWSVYLDLLILWKTAGAVLRLSGR
ncbi:MAG: sugar transferase [Promethearchaeota archaeon]